MRMLILIIVLFTAMFVIANCGGGAPEWKQAQEKRPDVEVLHDMDILPSNDRIYVIKIDGCEYIIYDGNQAGAMVHKENCPNHSR